MLKLHYIGQFSSMPDVWAAYPYGGVEGDYIHVEEEEYYWNKYTRKWVDGKGNDAPSQGGETKPVDPITHVYRSTSLGGSFDDTNIHETFNAYTINLLNKYIQSVDGATKELSKSTQYILSLFTEGKANEALTLGGYTAKEIIENATADISRVEAKLDDMFTDVDHKVIKTTHSLDTQRDITAEGYVIGINGVVAMGIADAEDADENYRVERYDTLDESYNESMTNIPTSYSVAKIKKDIDVEMFPPFDSSKSYVRGDIVRYGRHAYRFITSKGVGDWNSARVEMLNYDRLTKPLAMSDNTITTIFDNVINGHG